MTEPDWLSRRTPPPPEELATAIREALKARNITTDAPSSMELLETAQSLLKKVLETECAAREAALDLLTADALVTYALQVGNEDPKDVGDFSKRALKTLAKAGATSTKSE